MQPLSGAVRPLVLLVALAALALPGTAGAAIDPLGPPWCGAPESDAAENLPDGSSPAHPAGSFPHIPFYAIGCTLEELAARSDGRMTVEVAGRTERGNELYLVTFNPLDTPARQKAFLNWKQVRRLAHADPARAQDLLASYGSEVKIPIFIQAGIHGNEYEGVDAALEVIEELALTPYGDDPRVDAVRGPAIVVVDVIQNPDGRIAGTRANGNGFDLNRDFVTQSQPETKISVAVMQEWLPPQMLDLHGYVTPVLINAPTKPHNPSIEYDLFLKWNQSRTHLNIQALAGSGFGGQRPVNDWCPNGSRPGASGLCAGGLQSGPEVAAGWDDWAPFYTPMYSQHVGLDASTFEMCNSTGTACGVPGSTTHTRGRLGAREQQEILVWSSFDFTLENRRELLHDLLERNLRGVTDAPRPACCETTDFVPEAASAADNDWMTDYPKAYVIPLGTGQRSNAEANRLVEWLLLNGIVVEELKQDVRHGDATFERGSYVVWLAQAHRGLAGTALGLGPDISAQISQLYAPPASWSHGYLWGADVVTIPDEADFAPISNRIEKPSRLPGGVEPGTASAYALPLDSPTAVRVVNALLGEGVDAQVATAETGGLPAGSIVFAADPATKIRLDAAGKEHGLTFRRARAGLAGLEPVERSPRIAVLTAAVDQQTWSLRNLGFVAEPISTATISSALEDPLADYDVVFNTAGWPTAGSQAVARARLTAFFARGGGYIGAGATGGTFLQSGGQVSGYAAATRTGNGRSGIVNGVNEGGASSPVVGTYPATDTAIMDPPTWFTSVPATLSVDARFPASGILASGFWLTSDAQSASAPGSPVIAHGENTAGTARITLFAMNPLYRADPERMWPAIGAAAFWAHQEP